MGVRPYMGFVREEGGFTTPAAAVALLLVCTLLFATLHGYNVGTRSGQIQYVADAGALAADNVVAEFVTAGQVVDALLLSCSLLAIIVYAVSAVAAFIPGGGGAAAAFADVGSKILQVRSKIASSAARGLEQAQKALPALAAVRAAACIEANAQVSGIDYTGFAVTFPATGASVQIADGAEVEAAMSDIESREADIQEKASRQQAVQQRADEAKRAAWLADCGASGMSMRERAQKLAGLSGAQNPSYSSVETWSFSVALQRVKSYYTVRAQREPGASQGGSPELVAESVARKRFYEYALAEVSKGSVATTALGAELPALMPLARNVEQIRATGLYTESVYPVSEAGSTRTIHAYTGCPRYLAGTPAGTASVADEEAGAVARCDVCEFSALTLGRVPSASTSIDNGFEYHYRKVVEASESYRQAVTELEQLNRELEAHADDIGQDISAAVTSLNGGRYSPQPPGRYGCVCVVYAPSAFAGAYPFVASDGTVPMRMAIAGATLAADPQDDAGDVVSDVAEGLMPQSIPGPGVLHVALSAWGSVLRAYAGGVEGLEDAFQTVLGAIPMVGTDLSAWTADSFSRALAGAGLEPADLATYKPVLVNTSHILERDGGSAAGALLSAKRAADAYGAASAGDLQVLRDELGRTASFDGAVEGGGLVLAELPFSDFGFGLPDGRVVLPAPEDLFGQVDSLLGTGRGPLP